MQYNYNDGGRSNYFKGTGGDCVARSIAIVTGKDYKEVYDFLAAGNKSQRKIKGKRNGCNFGQQTALKGINTTRSWFKRYMASLGFKYVSLELGKFRKVYFSNFKLPPGRIICNIKGHYFAVVDGVINDSYNPFEKDDKIVLGYWKLKNDNKLNNK